MGKKSVDQKIVLLVGNGNLIYSIAVCLLKAGYTVNLCTDNTREASAVIATHLYDISNQEKLPVMNTGRLNVSPEISEAETCGLAIVVTAEDVVIKKNMIARLEKALPEGAIIAVNMESILLDEIQKNSIHPGRIIGLNWTEPAHTTHFLEIISNDTVTAGLIDQLNDWAKSWNKDPYVVNNFGIRSRMMSAMAREALYLVDQGYASVHDIDRACRNDAGYYLPFAGNCRYMDLMGTHAYGTVMKDLNPGLSKEQKLPDFFLDIIKHGGLGMQNGQGLYKYSPGELAHWNKIVNEFSYKIEAIINKYPFNYKEKNYMKENI